MRNLPVLACLVTSALCAGSATAQDAAPSKDAAKPADAKPADTKATDAKPAEAKPAGLIPVPDYSGDLHERPALTGDWGGERTKLADKGVQFDLTWSQYLQGVASGGRDETTKYGGKGDYRVLFDLDRMGVAPGALVEFRAESRYGDSVNTDSGLLLPVNTDFFFPLTSEPNDSVPFTIVDLLYSQYFSEEFGVFVGKFDTLGGDPNEFASGRGVTQFMNSNFVYNAELAARTPYSTLGFGAVWMPTENVTVTNSLYNTADSSTTSGFENLGDGLTWNFETDFQYRLGELPGGMNVGTLYSFDQDFSVIGGNLIFEPGEGLIVPTVGESWSVYWSGWQYLHVADDPGEKKINTADGRADLRGIGVFARFGFGDQDTNPVEWAGSFGVGGRGPIDSRPDDTYGVGYFYTNLKTTNFTGAVGIGDHTQGLEAYYDFSLTPAAHLSLNAQFVDSATPNTDEAVLLGARLVLTF